MADANRPRAGVPHPPVAGGAIVTVRGVVSAHLEAVLRLQIRGPAEAATEFDAVIDTGYTGLLTLPTAAAEALGLERGMGGDAGRRNGTERQALHADTGRGRSAIEGKRMGWASKYINKLRAGETVSFRPRGNSMPGKIESGQLCTVAPVVPKTLDVGDIVLCKVNGREYLHLVKAIQGPRFQIGNNRGRINGWVSANAIFGKLVAIAA
jgi:hypothetical protein